MKRNERHSHNPKSMQRDNKESGSIFLGLGLGGYGIYLVLYFGNNWIICRFMDFNFLTGNGVNEMKPISLVKQILSGIPKEVRAIHQAENFVRVAMLSAHQSVHPVNSEIKRVKLAHGIEVIYLVVSTLKRCYHLNIIKITTVQGLDTKTSIFVEYPYELKNSVPLLESLDEYRRVLGVV